MKIGMESEERKFPVAKEGMIFIIPLGALSLVLWVMPFPALAAVCSLLTLFVIYFFRDPERAIPPGEKAVLSPADGKVIQVQPSFRPDHRFVLFGGKVLAGRLGSGLRRQ